MRGAASHSLFVRAPWHAAPERAHSLYVRTHKYIFELIRSKGERAAGRQDSGASSPNAAAAAGLPLSHFEVLSRNPWGSPRCRRSRLLPVFPPQVVDPGELDLFPRQRRLAVAAAAAAEEDEDEARRPRR